MKRPADISWFLVKKGRSGGLLQRLMNWTTSLAKVSTEVHPIQISLLATRRQSIPILARGAKPAVQAVAAQGVGAEVEGAAGAAGAVDVQHVGGEVAQSERSGCPFGT